MKTRAFSYAALSLTIQYLGHYASALPNPASKNCIQLGGRLLVETDVKGAYGICVFDHDQQCEEWALLREDCPIGGIDITGYTTRENIFCAIRGGKVLENEAQCQLPSGHLCPIEDFYTRKCPSQGEMLDPQTRSHHSENRQEMTSLQADPIQIMQHTLRHREPSTRASRSRKKR